MQNTSMKKLTKIFLIFFLISLTGCILSFKFLLQSVFLGNKIVFNFSTLGYVGLVFFVLTLGFGTYLYIKFLTSQRFNNMLFFTTVPLTIVFATVLYFMYNIKSFQSPQIEAIRLVLKVSETNNNNYLWVILITLVYLIIIFFTFYFVCKPLKRVEKAVFRLSDGRVKNYISIGGSKQFKDIEFGLNKINENYKQKENIIEKTNSEYEKFIPKEFIKYFGKSNVLELELGNQVQKEVTTMFCDIRNSTNISTSLSLEENFNFVNSYLNLISPIIRKYNGFVDKYLGDGILAVFTKSEQALNCSKAIFSAIEDKNMKQKKYPSLKASISLNTGEVVFGVVGEEARKSLTIVSDSVNFAGKMEDVNKYFGTSIIFSKSTLNSLPANMDLAYRYIGTLKENGFDIPIFESLEVYGKIKRQKLLTQKGLFENAVRFFNEKDYKKASDIFKNILKNNKEDEVSYIYYSRCEENLKNPN